METNNDELLTNIFRTKVQNMKKDTKVSTENNQLNAIVLAIVGVGKWFALSTIVWLGALSFSTIVAYTVPGYWATFGILAGVRALQMMLIDPIVKKKNS
jgi:hypothetical protein